MTDQTIRPCSGRIRSNTKRTAIPTHWKKALARPQASQRFSVRGASRSFSHRKARDQRGEGPRNYFLHPRSVFRCRGCTAAPPTSSVPRLGPARVVPMHTGGPGPTASDRRAAHTRGPTPPIFGRDTFLSPTRSPTTTAVGRRAVSLCGGGAAPVPASGGLSTRKALRELPARSLSGRRRCVPPPYRKATPGEGKGRCPSTGSLWPRT